MTAQTTGGDDHAMVRPGKGFIAVLGQGYVGLPLAMRSVDAGHHVVGFDVDPVRVGRLARADSFVEDVADSELRQALDSGQYLPTHSSEDLDEFAVAIITVPTPLRDGSPDLSYIERAAEVLGSRITPGSTVVLESTTYPGTTEQFLRGLLERRSGLTAEIDFFLGYSPERIDPGNRLYSLSNTPKVVAGIGPRSLEAVEAFYQSVVSETVRVSRPREAELAKLIENTFRHVNIALLNELAMFAADLDVDIWEAIDAAATKPFGFMRFTPGPGVGGHCLPIDPSYLSWHVRATLGRSFRFVELANDINEHMPQYVVQRLTEGLNRRGLPVQGRRVLLLGLAYKPNTSDMRESPAIAIARRLQDLGAEVVYHDRFVEEEGTHNDAGLRSTPLDPQAVASADACILITDHDDVDYLMVGRHARYVLDTRHRCSGPEVEYL